MHIISICPSCLALHPGFFWAKTVSVTLHTVTSMCPVMLQKFESRQVANVLWAIAALRDRQDELTRRLDARILQVPPSSGQQSSM